MPSGCLTRLPWLTALLALIQAGAALRALQTPPELAAQVSMPLPLEFVGGALWGSIFALVTIALLRRAPRAFLWAGWSLLIFIGYNMVRWLLFTQADYDRQRVNTGFTDVQHFNANHLTIFVQVKREVRGNLLRFHDHIVCELDIHGVGLVVIYHLHDAPHFTRFLPYGDSTTEIFSLSVYPSPAG